MPPVSQPPPKQPLSPAARRRRRNLIMAIVAVLAVAALVIGLLAWAPWVKPKPKVPTGLKSGTATATTATVSWTPGQGGPKVDQFVVLRDGKQIATVAGTQTTYTDKDLKPGATYHYTVIAKTGSRESAASAEVRATTATPSPVGLKKGSVSQTWLTFSWSAPPEAPKPDQYTILRDSATVKTVPGTTTSFKDTRLKPVTTYSYQIVAKWGDFSSNPSTELKVQTAPPPVSAARLSGDFDVSFRIVSTGGGNVGAGETWTDTWSFTPRCSSGACATTLNGDVAPDGFTTHSFKLTLNRAGASYSGSTRAHITHCGDKPLQVDVTNNVTVRLTVNRGHAYNDEWLAYTWAGSMTIESPYTAAGSFFCPAQSINVNISGS